MKKKILMSAFMVGSMLASFSSFADIEKTVNGKATFTHIPFTDRQYNLTCPESRIKCLDVYTDGSLGINDNGNTIAAWPASFSPVPTFSPDPNAPGQYIMTDVMIIEIAPNQQLPTP